MKTNRSNLVRRIVIASALVCLVLGFVAFFLLYGSGTPGLESNLANDALDVDNDELADSGKQKKQKRRFPKIDRRTRAIMLQKILTAIQEKRKIGTTAQAEKPRTTDNLPKRYISKKIFEISPLIQECYEMELEDRGHVGGKVVVEIGFVGDEEYGGLVEEVKILESQLSREHSESFLECLRESLYAIQLDAPEWGGRQTVKYPFFFASLGF